MDVIPVLPLSSKIRSVVGLIGCLKFLLLKLFVTIFWPALIHPNQDVKSGSDLSFYFYRNSRMICGFFKRSYYALLPCLICFGLLFCLWSNRALGNQNKWVFWRGTETKKKDAKERLPAITKVQICQLCLWMNELNCCWFALAFNGQSCYTMSCLFIVSQFSFNLVPWTLIPPQISFHQRSGSWSKSTRSSMGL